MPVITFPVETYFSVCYVQESRTSMECFWDLKISKYVEKLVHVSSEYLKSYVFLSQTSMVASSNYTHSLGLHNRIKHAQDIYACSTHALLCVRGTIDLYCMCCRVHPCDWGFDICHFKFFNQWSWTSLGLNLYSVGNIACKFTVIKIASNPCSSSPWERAESGN